MPLDEVTPLQPDDGAAATEASALLNRALGDGLYRPEWLVADAANPGAGVWIARAVGREKEDDLPPLTPRQLKGGSDDLPPLTPRQMRGGGTVGVAVARLLGAGDDAYYRPFGAAAMELLQGSVASFEALAVDPAHRRRGLGVALTTTALGWFCDNGCDTAVTLSWRSNRDGSAGLFRRLGMREGPTIDRFYHEESLRDGWVCPVCKGPCTCAATLFTLPLGKRRLGDERARI
ncbi:MAG TPA: GNAT family N-acetyltransferase [Candidatus Dormibacteraeota bacterium]